MAEIITNAWLWLNYGQIVPADYTCKLYLQIIPAEKSFTIQTPKSNAKSPISYVQFSAFQIKFQKSKLLAKIRSFDLDKPMFAGVWNYYKS